MESPQAERHDRMPVILEPGDCRHGWVRRGSSGIVAASGAERDIAHLAGGSARGQPAEQWRGAGQVTLKELLVEEPDASGGESGR
jgi:hypothetical protein